MKVLIVSHNCLSRSNNMGRTLTACFRAFAPEELAQFYIHSEPPEDGDLCRNYYRFTDVDALLSRFQNRGTVFRGPVEAASGNNRAVQQLYQWGRKRTALVYALRELLWRTSRWNTRQFRQWLEDVAPDLVFLAAGDYGFLYNIAGKIAAARKIPLAVSCVDDFYLYHCHGNNFLGRLVHRAFLKTVHSTMAQARLIFAICPAMKREYEALFGKSCHLLCTPAEGRRLPCAEGGPKRLTYFGNLDNGRGCRLVEIGQALGAIRGPGIPGFLDVYSGERDPKYTAMLTPGNGIRFHGAVPPEQIGALMAESMAVIHTESFAPEIQDRVRLSVSTKIPDILQNGPCLIAYGPEGIASVDYLRENGAAYVISDPEQLESGLREILSDPCLRGKVTAQARALAEENHSMDRVPVKLRAWLATTCEEARL